MKKPSGDSIAKCSLCHVHAFTLRFFRRKGFGGFLSDPSLGDMGSFGNGEAKPEHVSDHIVDVAGIIHNIKGRGPTWTGTWNYQRGTSLE